MYRIFPMLLFLVGLTACAPATQTVTVGVPITDELIASIEQGKTTKSELVARLGRPTTTTSMPNGTSIAAWSYRHSERRGYKEGRNYIFSRRVMPVVDTRALSVTFDENDVVKAVTHSSHHYGDAPVTIENKTLP